MRKTIIAVVLVTGFLSAQDGVLRIDNRKQLFVDHKFIESAEGVSLTMNPPARMGEVLVKTDKPWEEGLYIGSYSSIIKEDGKIRLWYELAGIKHEPGQNPDFLGVAYAESKDGIHFEKPILNLVEYEGSRANNFVLPPDPKLMSQGGVSIQRDTNPNVNPAERYKSWQKIYPKRGTGIQGPHRLFVSPDGLRWTLSPKLMTGLRAADTQPTWFWDPRIKRYVGYSREWVQFTGEQRIRMASYNESDDLYKWDKAHVAIQSDEKDLAVGVRPLVNFNKTKLDGETLIPIVEAKATPSSPSPAKAKKESAVPYEDQVPQPGGAMDFYGPGVIPYEEADGVYIGLMSAFYHWNVNPSGPDTADVRLGISRNGKHFQYPGKREPFLRLGPSSATDSKWIWALPQLIRMNDEIWIYYVGLNKDHSSRPAPEATELKSGVLRAVLRLDGFVSADFDYTGGTLLTPPVISSGSQLELNLDTAAGGLARVEILDADGTPIPGFSFLEADQLNSNSVRLKASWNGKTDTSSLAGRPVRLHFKMRSAKLYAFQFR